MTTTTILTPRPATGPAYLSYLRKRLWLGGLVVDAVMIAVTAYFWPELLRDLLFGIGLGMFYLWSLFFNAEHPKGKGQFAFSLMRMVILAYVIVQAGHAQVREVAIVICGLLSYKVVLTGEYVIQALPAFRMRPRRTPSAPISSSRDEFQQQQAIRHPS